MTDQEKYENAFLEVFAVDKSQLGDNFTKEMVAAWDSIHQLNITANIEELFDIMLEPEDIMAFISFDAGKQILAKYDIHL